MKTIIEKLALLLVTVFCAFPLLAQTTVTLNLPAGGAQSYPLAAHPRMLWDGSPWKGAWSNTTAYWALDSVSQGGTNYQAVQASTGITPGTNAAYWAACPDCGAGQGTLTASMHNSAAGSGRADPNYPPFITMKNSVDGWLAAHPNYATDILPDLFLYDRNFYNCAWAAVLSYQTQNSSYLDFAHFCLNNVQQFQSSFQCDTSYDECNWYQSFYYSSGSNYNIAVLREFAGQVLTSGEMTTLTNTIFNDNNTLHNGLNTSGSGCSTTSNLVSEKPGTITGSGTTVTGVGTAFDSTYVNKVLIDSNGNVIGYVVSVQSATSLTIAETAEGGAGNFYAVSLNLSYSSTTSSCGLIWQLKHARATPPLPLGQGSTFATNYPPESGTGCGLGTSSLSSTLSNNCYQYYDNMLKVAESFADDDPRAALLLEQLYNYWQAAIAGYELSSWTGLDQGGAQYGTWVYATRTPTVDLSTQNTIIGIPNALSGILNNRFIYYYIFMQDPSKGYPFMVPTGDNNGSSFSGTGWLLRSMAVPLYLADSTAANYGYYYYKTTLNQWKPSGTPLSLGSSYEFVLWADTYWNPASAGVSPTSGGLPTQFLFRDTDSSLCSSIATYCYSGTTYARYNYFDSKSDWTTTATQLYAMAPTEPAIGVDHGGITFGSYHIHRNGFELLGGDDSGGGGAVETGPAYTDPGTENLIEIGSYTNFPIYTNNPVYGNILRWAGTDPNGDSQSRYSYALLDAGTNSYLGGNPTRVQRHILHFKKAGTQDYVVVYDDVATGTAETLKAYHHYFLNGQMEASVITANLSARTMVNKQASSALISAFLPVEGANSLALQKDASDGTYPYGVGATYRVYGCASTDGSTCASAESLEEIVVHLPTLTTTATMPALTQPTCTASGGNCTAVQIGDGSSPKVAVFARQGSLLTGAVFTTTHTGTAQYAVVGLAAGSAAVTVNGSPVAGSPFTVNAGDNTVYFESTAGNIIVGTAPPVLTSITVTPSTATILTGSGSQQFTATCYYGVGYDNCAGNPPSWSSSSMGVATINSGTGLATAGATAGSTTITATSGSIHGTALLSTQNVPTSTWTGVTMNNVTIK